MGPIPEATVEKTWQEVACFNPERPKKEMMRIGNSQPELLAFVTGLSEEIHKAVKELAIYIFLVEQEKRKAGAKMANIIGDGVYFQTALCGEVCS